MCGRLAFILALIVLVPAGPLRASDSDLRRELLDGLLAQQDWDSREANSRLLVHGPILPEEIEHLTAKASSGTRTIARNATRLLGIARVSDANDALRQLAANSDDEGVVVLALAPIDETGGASLAVQRKDAIQRALREAGRSQRPRYVPHFTQVFPILPLRSASSSQTRRPSRATRRRRSWPRPGQGSRKPRCTRS